MSMLAEMTRRLQTLTPGTEWEVIRRPQARRYILKASRSDGAHLFFRSFGGWQGLTYSQALLIVASLCDMVSMGFIPVARSDP